MHSHGARSFLDLKLHDIPATMARATTAAVAQKAAYLTVHAAAGPTALRAVAEAARGSSTQVLAVTVLTSMSDYDLHATGVDSVLAEVVLQRAEMALDAGIDGVILFVPTQTVGYQPGQISALGEALKPLVGG